MNNLLYGHNTDERIATAFSVYMLPCPKDSFGDDQENALIAINRCYLATAVQLRSFLESVMKPLLPVVLCFLCLACKEDYDPPKPATVQLVFEDASCTEAWLKVSLTDANEPRTVAVKRDGQTVLTARLTANDTTLVDTSLLPKRSYSYQAVRLNNNSPVDTSPTLQVTTMDTTSHNFTWQIDTLGVTSSVLFDVAIINDTLAYAVGEIFLNDSTGQLDPVYYNVAKWNGRRWEIFRILSNCRLYYPNCGPVTLTVAPGRAVFAFGWNDVWIAAGGIHHFDGSQWTEQRAIIEVGSTNKIWGSSSSNLWLVGNNGLIIHYNGNTWQRVESGTTLPIWDIFGARDERTGEYEIICAASNHSFPEGRKLLKILGSSVTALPDSGLPWSIDEIWFVPGSKHIVVGDGLYEVRRLGEVWTRNSMLPPLYKESIDGQGFNDIVVVGSFWNFVHFNGLTWRSYFPFASGSFGSVTISGNLVIAAGVIGNRALVVKGRR